MSARTGRWVERGLLTPACGPRLGQSLFGGAYVTSVPAGPCHCAGRAKHGRLPGLPWGGRGSPFVASFLFPRCWGLLVWLARGVRPGPQGESSPWAA